MAGAGVGVVAYDAEFSSVHRRAHSLNVRIKRVSPLGVDDGREPGSYGNVSIIRTEIPVDGWIPREVPKLSITWTQCAGGELRDAPAPMIKTFFSGPLSQRAVINTCHASDSIIKFSASIGYVWAQQDDYGTQRLIPMCARWHDGGRWHVYPVPGAGYRPDTDIIAIETNHWGAIFLDDCGHVFCKYGLLDVPPPHYGSRIPVDHGNVECIYSTGNAFGALTRSGHFFTWGDRSRGGGYECEDIVQVEDYGGDGFVALSNSGDVHFMYDKHITRQIGGGIKSIVLAYTMPRTTCYGVGDTGMVHIEGVEKHISSWDVDVPPELLSPCAAGIKIMSVLCNETGFSCVVRIGDATHVYICHRGRVTVNFGPHDVIRHECSEVGFGYVLDDGRAYVYIPRQLNGFLPLGGFVDVVTVWGRAFVFRRGDRTVEVVLDAPYLRSMPPIVDAQLFACGNWRATGAPLRL